jgi:hypothetical protein
MAVATLKNTVPTCHRPTYAVQQAASFINDLIDADEQSGRRAKVETPCSLEVEKTAIS